MDFLPELQLPWRLEEMRVIRGDLTVIRVIVSERLPLPDSHGRHVKDALSWPEVSITRSTAEFRFDNIYVIRVSEEESEAELDAPIFEGASFRRYFDSLLLREQREFRPELEHEFMHFRLTFPDERIDVICTRPPTISLHHADRGELRHPA